MRVRKYSSLQLVIISLLIVLLPAAAELRFNRDACYANVKPMLEDGRLLRNDSVFFRDDNGQPQSDPERPVMTIAGCEALCGKPFGYYKDIGPRLSTWLIPVFLLLSNMEVSPLDKRRYLMILHLLGDPIDSLWCLLLKMEAWSRCYRMARMTCRRNGRRARNLATVLGGFEELVSFYGDPQEVYLSILERAKANHMLSSTQIEDLVSRTALQLADSRTDERLRTILAAALYIYQIISAFVATVGGGNTSPPGGRIGLAMFMAWIIVAILLSNAIGGFPSRRTCFSILDAFVQDLSPGTDLWMELQRTVPELSQHQTLDNYYGALAWSGAIYTYRPSKRLPFVSAARDRSPYTLLCLSLTPIIISAIIASVIIWTVPPVGINCRNLVIFSLAILQFLSVLITWLTAQLGLSGLAHWYTVLAKDSLLAVPSVALVFLATSGRFNSCWCWSGVYSLGARARVPLNPIADFNKYNRTTYPILVGVCLTLLLLSFITMMWAGWRGWNVMRWSEEERRDEWFRSRSLSGNEKRQGC